MEQRSPQCFRWFTAISDPMVSGESSIAKVAVRTSESSDSELQISSRTVWKIVNRAESELSQVSSAG